MDRSEELYSESHAVTPGGVSSPVRAFKPYPLFIESGDVTVLFVSHSIEQVERICRRAVWIEKGDLRMDGQQESFCRFHFDPKVVPVKEIQDGAKEILLENL